jgi:ribokinase
MSLFTPSSGLFHPKKDIEFLAVGDIVTDAFIRLHEAHVDCDKDTGTCELSMSYGNKIPYESVEIIRAVGNSANAAVSASRLGLSSALVASIGDDDEGVKAIETLHQDRVITEYILVNKGKKTNYHYVLWYGSDRTILVKHEEYRYVFPHKSKPAWIYLSSLGEKAMGLHDEILKFLGNNPDTKLVFQPGTFQIKLGKDKLKEIYNHTDIFFCNVEEAELILERTDLDKRDLLRAIRALGPKIAVITDGAKGAYADDGTHQVFLSNYPDPKEPFERTGAGDAFASTVTAMIIKGKSLSTSLKYAAINSTYVVQDIGAQKGLLTQTKIEELLENASATWDIQDL